jgi:hypothetical protein
VCGGCVSRALSLKLQQELLATRLEQVTHRQLLLFVVAWWLTCT